MKPRTAKRLTVLWAALALVAAMGFDWHGDLPALFAAGGFLLGSGMFALYAVWLDVDEMTESEPASVRFERLATEEETPGDPR
jgi:hypothetical protein